MVYKPIGKKSPVKPFKSRKYAKRLNRQIKSTLFKSRAELALGQKSSQYATISETVLLADININTTNYETFQLSQFSRAMQIAPNFKWYRAKKVIFKYEPLYNYYTEGNESLPYMYTIMNRTQDRTAYTAGQLRMQGSVPKVFKSTVTVAYKPNWCTQGLGAYTQIQQPTQGPITSINATGLQKCYNWLQTPCYNGALDTATPIMSNTLLAGNVNPMALYTAQTIYNGHLVYFDQTVPQGSPVVCRRTVTVVWEFKGPKVDINLHEGRDPQGVVTVDLSNGNVAQVLEV